MFLNGFSVRIEGGRELPNGYVALKHGSTYRLVLGNRNDIRADCTVLVDGKEVGTFRLHARSTVRIERPVNEAKLFTFYRASSYEGQRVSVGVTADQQGLIECRFVPEDRSKPSAIVTVSPPTYHTTSCGFGPELPGNGDALYSANTSHGGATRSLCNVSAGVSGLSGQSAQTFTEVERLDYDWAASQTIVLRLVCDEPVADPVAIRPVSSARTPTPPAIR